MLREYRVVLSWALTVATFLSFPAAWSVSWILIRHDLPRSLARSNFPARQRAPPAQCAFNGNEAGPWVAGRPLPSIPIRAPLRSAAAHRKPFQRLERGAGATEELAEKKPAEACRSVRGQS